MDPVGDGGMMVGAEGLDGERFDGDKFDGGLLVVDTERFHGPLDLLLHLVRTQDIDVFDVPIAAITRQFLAAIEGLRNTDVDEAGEFLEMAAALVRIKVRMLLPGPAGEEEHDPRAELVRRLLEYEQIREIAGRLRSAEDDRGRRFGKGFVQPRSRPTAVETPLTITWDDVFAAALGIEAPAEPDREHRVETRPVSMREKADLIVAAVMRARRIEFAELIAPWKERMHGVMTFLAGLELGRRRVVSLRQTEAFAPLWIYRGPSAVFDGDDPVAADTSGSDRGPTGSARHPEAPR